MIRRRPVGGGSEAGLYFNNDGRLEFIPTGCTVLDKVVGGGWALGRMVNIIGDKSTGKTLLAIEACANFAQKYPDGKIWYREVEAAFDESYARLLGLPVARVEFLSPDKPMVMVEEWQVDLANKAAAKAKQPGLYILDSLDALSDKAELEREVGKGSYGAAKAKGVSELFRKVNQSVSGANITVFIISQVRDKIGVMFGDKTGRSGGRALDFYASQVLKLSQIGTVTHTKKGVKRVVGVTIRAKCTKNKVGLPFRSCDLHIMFAYGIDNAAASAMWLKENNRLDPYYDKKRIDDLIKGRGMLIPEAEYRDLDKALAKDVRKAWPEIETMFLPTRRKYE